MTKPASPIDEILLRQAVSSGVITHDQANRLLALAAETAERPKEPQDDEKLRFITGFNDIFVTLGCGLFLGALGYLASQFHGALAGGAVAATSWLLAEYFTRRRRMALPSIVLVGTFVAGVFIAASGAFHGAVSIDDVGPVSAAMGAVVALGAAALHYWRFRVPITIAAGAAAAGGALLAILSAAAPELTPALLQPILIVLGLAAFTLAMRFDLKDPERLTLNTDIAFWLHLLAAPLIVHPLISGIADVGGGTMTTGSALAVLATFLALGLVALAVDRRAMLVSGLVYAGVAFSRLVGLSEDTGWPLTMLVLGIFVLTLSAGWHPLRRTILACLPSGVSARLPHPLTSG
ncbi:hypothetical protein GCM10007276_02570 [Agaricicola taiwanensis]|uniref:DUF2157 domain-containing protein n=1 Tax=Agaricicola taiwanensis TaxID=591372 RepID=A0A8J2YBU2_9RHOB|nr:hypothetical protein [Agaricicola taiwanensis]GGE28900.1 hypothetical protein GCM10007276_02570 [Agaricicola taiwanensis]